MKFEINNYEINEEKVLTICSSLLSVTILIKKILMFSLQLIVSLLFIVAEQLVEANFAVFDIFKTVENCVELQPVQASITREIGICINLPSDFPDSFFDSTKRSYRFDSCSVLNPHLSLLVSGDFYLFNQSVLLPKLNYIIFSV